ncbi:unnamed protein product [Sphagnum jensenii]|uniref:SURP and G-patch domain-containing protein 1-like protein n=1 Tax=Sphagnum jensenii TaxID=128206 RepID=A0ABP1AC29_9BRYO
MAGLSPNNISPVENFKDFQQEHVSFQDARETNPLQNVNMAKKDRSILQSAEASPQGGTLKLANSTNGKLAFSLKQKTRLFVNAITLGEDNDHGNNTETEQQLKKARIEKFPGSISHERREPVPPVPSDQEVKKAADKLASFVAKNGRQFENVTRQKNPGDTPFRFLFDTKGAEYKYYEYRLAQEEKALSSEFHGATTAHTGSGSSPAEHYQNSQLGQSVGRQHQTRYQTPASALFSGAENQKRLSQSSNHSWEQPQECSSQHNFANDSVAMMEFYMKKAAQEDLRKPLKHCKDEMPPTPSLQPPPCAGKKGHHMGDYIPPEELEKFMSKCNDAKAVKAAKATADRAKIQADNVGHRLLSKMGWKEGEGLGSGRSGQADPVQAGQVKLNNLGVGAEQPGEVTAEDDIYEQYKKRMMLGYRYRPNPLNNPRKAYY